MENAGAAVVDYLSDASLALSTRQVLVLCGKGNNGGAGFVVARRLRERNAPPRVFLAAESSEVRGDAAVNLRRWQEGGGGELHVVTSGDNWAPARETVDQADLIVDAFLATGAKGPGKGQLATRIEAVNRLRRLGRERIR